MIYTDCNMSDELREENRKIARVRRLIDVTCALAGHPSVSLLEACALMRYAKSQTLQLFPDGEATFELLYRSRFTRIVNERLRSSPEYSN
jgi:hypothetical protein